MQWDDCKALVLGTVVAPPKSSVSGDGSVLTRVRIKTTGFYPTCSGKVPFDSEVFLLASGDWATLANKFRLGQKIQAEGPVVPRNWKNNRGADESIAEVVCYDLQNVPQGCQDINRATAKGVAVSKPLVRQKEDKKLVVTLMLRVPGIDKTISQEDIIRLSTIGTVAVDVTKAIVAQMQVRAAGYLQVYKEPKDGQDLFNWDIRAIEVSTQQHQGRRYERDKTAFRR